MTRAPGQSEITKRRQPRWRTAGLVLFFSLIALAFTRAAYVQFGYWGIQDWDIFFFYHGAPAVVVRDFHQFPLWNPWFCGGMPMLARPESPILSPLFLLTLWLGAVHGLKVQIVLHLVGGLCGTYVLARHLACSRLAAVLAAFVYMLGGAYAQHMAVGNAWAFSMGFMPWAVWCWLKAQASAERASRFALACAAVLVLMWFSGAPYPMVITLLFFGAHTLIGIAMREWRPRPALRVLLTVTLLTFGLGAIKFLPSLEFTMQYPRVAEMSTGFSLDSLRHGLFARDQTLHAAEAWRHGPGFLHGVSQAMNETGSYLGLAPFCLFVIGAVSQAKRRRALLLCLLLFLWLGFGVRAPLSIWNVLHDLPVFSITRVAERFRLIFLLLVAIFAAFGLDRLSASVRKRAAWGRAPDAVAALVVLGVWVDLMLVVAPLFAQAFTIQPLTMPPAPGRAFAQTASHYAIGPRGWATAEDDQTLSAWSSHYPALLSNLGVILGNEDTPVPKEALAVDAPDYRGEVYLHGTTGTASFTRWSPNDLAIRARATGEGYVVVNQNYYPGWRVKGAPGRRVEAVDRLLAVRVGPGEHTLTLTYRPTSFMLGAGLSLATLAACVWWLRRLRHAQPAPAWCLALAARVPRDLTPATRIALALAAITLCVYLPALQADFVNIDDDIYVTENAHVKTGLTWANVGWAFTATERANYWHPLTWLSHMLDVELYGLRAAGHHLTSVLLHVLNTVLLFWVLRMLTRGGAAHGAATTVCGCAGSAVVAPPCGALYPAAFVAALFALHPLHVESVAWIAERKDVLSTLFWILTLGAYGRYCRMQIADCRLTDGRRAPLSVSNLQSSIGNRQCRAWYILTLLCFLLGLMAKPMLVTLPLVLLLLDYWPLRRGWKPVSSFISLLLEKLPFLLLALGASAWAFAAQREGEALRSLAQVPLGERVANALVSYGIYLFQTFWPRGLTIYYPLSDAARPLWQPISAALALAVVTGAVLWQARRRPYLFTGWFWYLITLLPVIGLVQIGTFAHADRYTYVPLIGVFIALAWGAQELQIADCRLQIADWQTSKGRTANP